MARCPNCNNVTLEGALICPSCDHPLQHSGDKLLSAYAAADRAARYVLDKPAHVQLNCSHCSHHHVHGIRKDGWLDFSCDKCRRPHRLLLATVRAKKSRGDKQRGSRAYTIRVRHSGQIEELISYEQSGYEDFEMRAGDFVSFIYAGQPPSIRAVQNLTIGTKRIVAGKAIGWDG